MLNFVHDIIECDQCTLWPCLSKLVLNNPRAIMLQSDSAYIKLCRDIVVIFKLMTYILTNLELKSWISFLLYLYFCVHWIHCQGIIHKLFSTKLHSSTRESHCYISGLIWFINNVYNVHLYGVLLLYIIHQKTVSTIKWYRSISQYIIYNHFFHRSNSTKEWSEIWKLVIVKYYSAYGNFVKKGYISQLLKYISSCFTPGDTYHLL